MSQHICERLGTEIESVFAFPRAAAQGFETSFRA